MSTNGWEIETSEVVGDYDVFKVRRVVARQEKQEKDFEFHIIDAPECVQTVAVTDDDRIILVQQFRQGIQKLSVEFPAGVVDDGEDCVRAALRELREETGYRAKRQEVLGRLAADPALNSNMVTIVAAYGCTKSDDQELDDAEDVEPLLVSRDEVEEMIESGRIQHGVMVAAWHLFTRAASTASRP